jgi:hypothetical protein
MTTTRLTPIDCKVPVRKWVLISSPSRWSQKWPRTRVIVYSPMLYIPKEASHVPVKRVSRDEEDTVSFLPRGDIEKDSGKIYDEIKVSRASSFVDAHGVAIVDGPDDRLRFSRGHRFWIHVGCKTEDYQKMGTVPVINLETLEAGIISASHVCVRTFGHLIYHVLACLRSMSPSTFPTVLVLFVRCLHSLDEKRVC